MGSFFSLRNPLIQVTRINLDELRTKQRHDRHRNHVRREKCDRNGESKRGEQISAYAAEQHYWKEDNAGAECCSENCKLYLLASTFRGNHRGLAHFHVAEDVLEHHHGIVDKPR